MVYYSVIELMKPYNTDSLMDLIILYMYNRRKLANPERQNMSFTYDHEKFVAKNRSLASAQTDNGTRLWKKGYSHLKVTRKVLF